MKKKIVTVIGARPQFIKAAALSRVIRSHYAEQIEEVIVHTGQHYDNNMSDVFFDELHIPAPIVNLACGSASHAEQQSCMMTKLEPIFREQDADAILVYGDTNTTLAAALVASKLNIPIIHVEAGLRSFNKKMPEEINRVLTDHLSTLLFCPTSTAVKNLEREGFNTNKSAGRNITIDQPYVVNCGDVMYDNTLFYSANTNQSNEILHRLGVEEGNYLMMTIHRPSNSDDLQRLTIIIETALHICQEHSLKLVFPVHPRTNEKLSRLTSKAIQEELTNPSILVLTNPTSYLETLSLIKHSQLIITDSGGLQKEAYFLNKRILICRDETEWTELVEQQQAMLVDADRNRMLEAYAYLSQAYNPTEKKLFGDGNAAQLICKTIIACL